MPHSGIDIDARWWGYSHTQGRMGFRIQTTSNMYNSSRETVVPLTAADVTTTASILDNKMYVPLTSSSPSSSVFSLPSLCYMTADPGYDDKKLDKYSKKILGIDLVCLY